MSEKHEKDLQLPSYTSDDAAPVPKARFKGPSIALLVVGLLLLQQRWQHPTRCSDWAHKLLRPTPKGPVDWVPCALNASYSCGYLEVPKNYYDAAAGKAYIAMLKVPATAPKSERLGSIFLNPGGPGGSGVAFGAAFGAHFSDLLDGRYDLIGFDPRGIGSTRPLVECFNSSLDYSLFKAGTILERGFDLSPNPRSEEGRQRLLEQHQQLMGLQETEFRVCGETMGDELRYMGTSTVVRDIEEMSRVLDGAEAKINFFGGSYGTVLGAYLVNMIPEKIGRVLIDGVASARQWANEFPPEWLHDWVVDTESTFQWFLRDCSKAGPNHCPLAKTGEDPLAIQDRLIAFLDSLYTSPIAVPDARRPGILTSGMARAVLYGSTNQPGSWYPLSHIFAQALEGNVTALYNAVVPPFPSHSQRSQTDLSRAAVACADSPPYLGGRKTWPTAEYMVNKTLYNLESSPHFGASVSLIEPDGGCQFWPASGKAPERFTGPWNATLSTPVLIVSNTADPITPLASGRELNALLGPSSRLLIQNSPGHCSLGSVSRGTMGYYRRYFLKGELPEDETMTQVDKGYFPTDEQEFEKGDMQEGWVMVGENEEEDDKLRRVAEAMAKSWAECARAY